MINRAAYGNQKYSSAETSINSSRRPRIYSAAADMIKGRVIDYGCGRYFDNYDFSDLAADVSGYDKYNRPDGADLAAAYDVAICSNVLNVIEEKEIRVGIISELFRLAPVALVTVYEGTPGKPAGPTKAGCYQLNRKAAEYLPELESVYGAGNVELKKGVFTCRRPA